MIHLQPTNDEVLLHPYSFRAMNTQIELLFRPVEADGSYYANIAAGYFQDAEERFSRFIEDSELSRLNRAAGTRCMVSDPMLEVLLLAESYQQATYGVFNPLILRALEQAGYDRTFDSLKERVPYDAQGEPIHHVNRDTLFIDPMTRSVKLPLGAKLDLGGIVKSWTVQRLAADLRQRLELKQGCINAGGDLEVWGGSKKPSDPWTIGIKNPWDAESDIGMIALCEGAAATSGTLGRRWETSDGPMHHLIDPVSMLPSRSDVVQCTVVGPELTACEVWAKTICILGADKGLALLSRKARQYEALLFMADRKIVYYGHKHSIDRIWKSIPIDHRITTN